MEGGRKLRSQMTNMKVSDAYQNPEVAESTEHEENVDNRKTIPGEASTDQNALLQALAMLHKELKDFTQGMRRDLDEFKNDVKKVLKDDLAKFCRSSRAKTLT